MPIPTLDPFLVGERATATKLTASTKGAIESAVHYKPFCHIQNPATFNLAIGNNGVPLTEIVDDTDGMGSISGNGSIIVKTAGLYRLTAQITFAFASGGFRGLNVYRNAIQWSFPRFPPVAITAAPTTIQWTFSGRFSVNEFVALNAQNDVAVNTNPASGVNDNSGSFLMMEWISK